MKSNIKNIKIFDIILIPYSSEKSNIILEKFDIITFKVNKIFNKIDIKIFIVNFFKLKIKKINTILIKKNIKKNKNKKKIWKKVFVILEPNQNLIYINKLKNLNYDK